MTLLLRRKTGYNLLKGNNVMKEIILPISISEGEVIRRLGYSSIQRVSNRTKSGVHNAIKDVVKASDTRTAYKYFPVTKRDKRYVEIDNRVKLSSKKIAGALKGCDSVAVFVTTLGSTIDALINNDNKIKMHKRILIDAVASCVAESQAEHIQQAINNLIEGEKGTTERYSPGYCDWPLQEQKKLFGLLPENPASVSLSSTCLMSPRKSISGIIGIGSSGEVKKYGNACKTCKNVSCLHRRNS